MRIYQFLNIILFGAFAYLQLNDPDPLVWVSLYGSVVVVAMLRLGGIYRPAIPVVVIAVMLIYAAFLVPDLLEWMRLGDDITGPMSAERPYIEGTREFFGLLIAILFLAAQWLFPPRRGKPLANASKEVIDQG